jgi:hypothetical protein
MKWVKHERKERCNVIISWPPDMDARRVSLFIRLYMSIMFLIWAMSVFFLLLSTQIAIAQIPDLKPAKALPAHDCGHASPSSANIGATPPNARRMQ